MVCKITFEMETPIAVNTPIHLDALLTAIHPAMHNREQRPSRYDREMVEPDVAPLPLASFRADGGWIWACTAMELPETAKMEVESITKRRTPQDVYNAMRTFMPGSNAMKDKFVKFQVVMTKEVYFWAITYDQKELERLIKRVKSIGGKRKAGYGKIKSYRLEKMEMEEKDILLLEGRARRRIPGKMLEQETWKKLACRSPYWYRHIAEPACEVGDDVKLSKNITIRYGRGEEHAVL